MIVGILKKCIRVALIKPRAIPTPAASRKAKKMLPPYFIITTAMTYSATVATAVKEISIPPEISTKVTPTAKIPIKE